jgi:hypothetical protein
LTKFGRRASSTSWYSQELQATLTDGPGSSYTIALQESN